MYISWFSGDGSAFKDDVRIEFDKCLKITVSFTEPSSNDGDALYSSGYTFSDRWSSEFHPSMRSGAIRYRVIVVGGAVLTTPVISVGIVSSLPRASEITRSDA
jgi:hypothetical protein